MVHCQKVILPLGIHDLQHEHPFVVTHRSCTDDGFLLVVLLVRLREKRFLELLRAELAGIDAFFLVIETELALDGNGQTVEIPFVRMRLGICVLGDEIDHDVVGDAHQVFLLVFALEQLPA